MKLCRKLVELKKLLRNSRLNTCNDILIILHYLRYTCTYLKKKCSLMILYEHKTINKQIYDVMQKAS